MLIWCCFSCTASLSAKLAEELIYEQENTEQEEPEFLRSVREAGVWTVSAAAISRDETAC